MHQIVAALHVGHLEDSYNSGTNLLCVVSFQSKSIPVSIQFISQSIIGNIVLHYIPSLEGVLMDQLERCRESRSLIGWDDSAFI